MACPNQPRRRLVIDDAGKNNTLESDSCEDDQNSINKEGHQTRGDEGTILMAYSVALRLSNVKNIGSVLTSSAQPALSKVIYVLLLSIMRVVAMLLRNPQSTS